MFNLFKKNRKENAPEKMVEVTYYWITSKGEGGAEETEIMTEKKMHELASCLYCIIVEVWEL